MHMKMGEDGRYNENIISRVTFQRDPSYPLTLKYVIYVPGWNKNLVSVATLEYHVYNVISSKGNYFLHHIATREVSWIGVRVKNLYKQDVEDCAYLSTKEEKL